MFLGRLASFALATLLAAWVVFADARSLAARLDTAEQARATDKPRSRQLLDAIQRELAANPEPRLVARAQLLECTWADQPPAAYRAVAIGLPAAERAGDVLLRARLLSCRAVALLFDGKDREAERDYTAAAGLARGKDEGLEADLLASLASIQYTRGAMADALTNLQAAYRTNVRLGREKARLDALTIIANVYADRQVGQYDRAIEYYQQLVTAYEKDGLAGDVADTLFNIGGTYDAKGNFTAAELHYRRALSAFEKLGQPKDIAFTRRALGSALMKQGRAAEALALFDLVLAFYEQEHQPANVAWARQFRGMAYRRLGRFDEALQELTLARRYYESENNSRFLERNTAETALLHAQRGDWHNAYENSRKHAEIQEALAAERRDEMSSRLRVEFDAEKKEQENRALARENALRTTALRAAQRNQKLQYLVIALTVLLAGTLAILFWRQVVNTRRMRAMALTDELTRLPNRRHILASAELAFSNAKREQREAGVIVLDIDRFKRINDTYGHAAGDLVLQGVARACRLELRSDDPIGRIGGEEFLIILRKTTPAQAADIAERLRAAIERLDFSSIAPDLRVTISLGVRVARQYDPRAMIAAADALLYRAKESGRNRVEMETAPA